MSYLKRSYISPDKEQQYSNQESRLPYQQSGSQSQYQQQYQQQQQPQQQYQNPTYGSQIISSNISSPLKQEHEVRAFNQENPMRVSMQQQELELWKSRCEELEDTLQQANNELLLANSRAQQQRQLEEKVDIVMKNNNKLMDQHNSLQKQLAQKQAEIDIWKSKYEKETNEKISSKMNTDDVLERLQEENRRLRDLLQEHNISSVKNIEAIRSEMETDKHKKVKNLQSDHCEDLTLYEEQVRKLREIVEDREREVSILNQKLESQKNANEIEKLKLDEDKQKLHTIMSQLELENQREKEITQSRTEVQQQNQIDNLKQHYQNQIDLQDSDIKKLRDLLELKNTEIQSLINQNKDQKINNDYEEGSLRDEIASLKNKILEVNTQKEEEMEDLQNRLEQAHETDIQGLRFHHENQMDSLEKEIGKLHEMIENKTQQIDEQIKEKLEQRQSYNNEIERLNDQIEGMKNKQQDLEDDLLNQKSDYENQLDSLRQNFKNEVENHSIQNQQLDATIKELQELVEIKQEEIEANRSQNKTVQEGLHKEINIYKDLSDEWESKYGKLAHESEQMIEDLKLEINVNRNEYTEQNRKNTITIESQEKEMERLQEINRTKAQENENLIQNKLQLEQEIRKLRADIDRLQENINIVERNKNQDLQDQRIKLEQSHQYSVQNIKSSFDNQVNIMEQEIRELNIRIQLKDREFQEYVDKYSKMEGLIRDFVNHPDKLRDKADVAATKNLYDILRTSNRSPVKRAYSPIKKSYF